MFDCDDTLVEWVWDKVKLEKVQDQLVEFNTPSSHQAELGNKLALFPIQDSINLLKAEKASGSTIVVWSAGGWQWAAEVVRGLGLESQVDLIMSKPIGYVDDLASDKWMGKFIKVKRGKIHPCYTNSLVRK